MSSCADRDGDSCNARATAFDLAASFVDGTTGPASRVGRSSAATSRLMIGRNSPSTNHSRPDWPLRSATDAVTRARATTTTAPTNPIRSRSPSVCLTGSTVGVEHRLHGGIQVFGLVAVGLECKPDRRHRAVRRVPNPDTPDVTQTSPVGYLTGAAWQGVVAGLLLAVPVWAGIVSLVLWAS